MPAADEELVVLLGPDRAPIGTMAKALVHTAQTPLHLAFSCYVVDTGGRLLVSRRALGKRTFPGLWTNTCCGHPAPGETLEAAAARRADAELGISLSDVTVVLPDFAYRATAADGIVENEVCPVLVARLADGSSPRPDPAEVAEWRWVAWESFLAAARYAPWALSPWSVLQAAELATLAPQVADLLGRP